MFFIIVRFIIYVVTINHLLETEFAPLVPIFVIFILLLDFIAQALFPMSFRVLKMYKLMEGAKVLQTEMGKDDLHKVFNKINEKSK